MAAVRQKPTPGQGRSATPILVRFFGCGDELRGVNGDYFTVGDAGDEDIPLPPALRRTRSTRIRFSRGPEGWRVTAADDLPLYVNQRRTVGLTDIESGDVVRLSPGGPGMQFLVRQQDATIARLATRHATKRTVAAPKADAAAEPTAEASGGSPWPKVVGVALVIGFALLLGYLAGTMQSAPGVDSAPAAVEASE